MIFLNNKIKLVRQQLKDIRLGKNEKNIEDLVDELSKANKEASELKRKLEVRCTIIRLNHLIRT